MARTELKPRPARTAAPMTMTSLRQRLGGGLVIPAHPLALTRLRKLDERRQRALTRYYLAAGAGGVAVGVHTTQFAIRDRKHGLLKPVLELAAETVAHAEPALTPSLSRRTGEGAETLTPSLSRPTGEGAIVLIAGVCGPTHQAVAEARLARTLGYHAGLLSLGALRDAPERALLTHCRVIAEELPVMGFYLQPAVGGRVLPFSFWRRFAEIENVVAIKIAPFNRYQTLDVVRAVAESGRDDIALYTGNDDNIVMDLLTPFTFRTNGKVVERRLVGGLLGHWAVWTRRAVEFHATCRALAKSGAPVPVAMLQRAAAETDANAALFDAAHGFAGCIAGVHEVLRRQGLLAGNWCLDPGERLSPGQALELDRVQREHPEVHDDAFVRERLEEWLR